MLDQLAQGVPREATLYGGEGGGPSLGKRTAFIIEQGAIMKTKQIFKVYHILLTRIVPIRRVDCTHHLQMADATEYFPPFSSPILVYVHCGTVHIINVSCQAAAA